MPDGVLLLSDFSARLAGRDDDFLDWPMMPRKILQRTQYFTLSSGWGRISPLPQKQVQITDLHHMVRLLCWGQQACSPTLSLKALSRATKLLPEGLLTGLAPRRRLACSQCASSFLLRRCNDRRGSSAGQGGMHVLLCFVQVLRLQRVPACEVYST